MNVLVTVCARGGSKGLPNKNLRPIGGKPLLAHTVEQAVRWGRGRVVCSTDSPEIARVAVEWGAEVPFLRPAEMATDQAGKVPVIRHALRECQRGRDPYDAVVDLDVTAPLRGLEDLDECLRVFAAERPEVLFTVTPARKNPYFNMVERSRDGSWSVVKKQDVAVTRRQDAPEVFDMNASIYVYDARALERESFGDVLAARFAVQLMPEDTAFDIDSERDAVVVEALMRHRGWF